MEKKQQWAKPHMTEIEVKITDYCTKPKEQGGHDLCYTDQNCS